MTVKKKQKRRTPYPVDWECRAVYFPAVGLRTDTDWDAVMKGRSADEAAVAFATDFYNDMALSHGEPYFDYVEVRKLSATHTTRISCIKVTAKLSVDWEGEEVDPTAPVQESPSESPDTRL